MRRLLPLLLLSCTHIEAQPNTVRTPLHQLGDLDTPTHRGERLLTLSGGGLTSAVAVPLWFDLVAPDDDAREKCSLSYEVSFFELERGWIYVSQYNPYCGGDACRILSTETHAFAEPEGGCIPAGDGIHRHVEGWGRGVVVVRSESEGAASARIGSFSREAGFRTIRDVDLGLTGRLEGHVTGEGIVLRSPCPLAGTGCDPLRDYTGAADRTFLYLFASGQMIPR